MTLLLALMKGLEAVMCQGSGDILQSQNCVMLYKRIQKNCWKWISRVSCHPQLLFYGRHHWPAGSSHVHGDFKGRQRTFIVQVRGQGLSYCVWQSRNRQNYIWQLIVKLWLSKVLRKPQILTSINKLFIFSIGDWGKCQTFVFLEILSEEVCYLELLVIKDENKGTSGGQVE